MVSSASVPESSYAEIPSRVERLNQNTHVCLLEHNNQHPHLSALTSVQGKDSSDFGSWLEWSDVQDVINLS